MRAAIGDRERAAVAQHRERDRPTAVLRGDHLTGLGVAQRLGDARPRVGAGCGAIDHAARGAADDPDRRELAGVDELEELAGDRVHSPTVATAPDSDVVEEWHSGDHSGIGPGSRAEITPWRFAHLHDRAGDRPEIAPAIAIIVAIARARDQRPRAAAIDASAAATTASTVKPSCSISTSAGADAP